MEASLHMQAVVVTMMPYHINADTVCPVQLAPCSAKHVRYTHMLYTLRQLLRDLTAHSTAVLFGTHELALLVGFASSERVPKWQLFSTL